MAEPAENMSWTLIIPEGSSERFIFFGQRQKDDLYHAMPRIGGISELKPGYCVRRPFFYAHELLFPLEGQLTIRQGDRAYELAPGETAFLPCDTPHEYGSGNALKFLWFHIRPELLPADPVPGFFVRASGYFNEIRLLSELLWQEERRHPERAERTEKALWRYLSDELCVSEQEHRYLRRIERTLEQVRQKLNHPWTVAGMAKLACMSESNFFSVTRELYNATPHTLLYRMRMEAASALLLRGNDDLGTVAARTGYADSFSFSKAFRKYAGCSPRTFRSRRQIT